MYFSPCYKFRQFTALLPVLVAVRSKTWVRSRSTSEIVVSNLAAGIDVCCECFQEEVSATS
jgi:hypothetical protein